MVSMYHCSMCPGLHRAAAITPAVNSKVRTHVTFGVYRFWRGYIDGCSALCVVYEVSLEVVMTTRA